MRPRVEYLLRPYTTPRISPFSCTAYDVLPENRHRTVTNAVQIEDGAGASAPARWNTQAAVASGQKRIPARPFRCSWATLTATPGAWHAPPPRTCSRSLAYAGHWTRTGSTRTTTSRFGTHQDRRMSLQGQRKASPLALAELRNRARPAASPSRKSCASRATAQNRPCSQGPRSQPNSVGINEAEHAERAVRPAYRDRQAVAEPVLSGFPPTPCAAPSARSEENPPATSRMAGPSASPTDASGPPGGMPGPRTGPAISGASSTGYGNRLTSARPVSPRRHALYRRWRPRAARTRHACRSRRSPPRQDSSRSRTRCHA